MKAQKIELKPTDSGFLTQAPTPLPVAEVTHVGPPVAATGGVTMDSVEDFVPTPATQAQPVVPAPAAAPADPNISHYGLPGVLLSKDSQVRYADLHGYGYRVRDSTVIEYTETERSFYERYASFVGTLASPKDLFVTCLRLFRAGFPLTKADIRDINLMKVS